MLLDQYGRRHNNLRISVTDRCNLRCVYCMPEDVTFLDKTELLSFEEIAQFVRVCAKLGVNKIRLTGGEPLLRRNLDELVRQLVGIPNITDIGLTTNGLLLAQQAAGLKHAGLHRLNVSLDTLDAEHFQTLTRRQGLPLVLAGLAEAKRVGYTDIKINAVAMRGRIEQDLIPLAHYCRENQFELRLIEYMPIGAEPWQREEMVPAHELLELLETHIAPLAPSADYDPSAPAMSFEYADGVGRLGIIASVTRPFCGHCNRLRLTAEGKLRNCLFALDEVDVKQHLRQQPFDEAALSQTIEANIWGKWPGHQINSADFHKPSRTMHTIGG